MLTYTEYKIADAEAKKEWEKLFGMKIYSNFVRVPYDTWQENMGAIYAIQMASALRIHK